jgi:transposase
LKRPENLTEKQTVKLAEVLKYNLRTVRAYLLREDFQRFCEYRSP